MQSKNNGCENILQTIDVNGTYIRELLKLDGGQGQFVVNGCLI